MEYEKILDESSRLDENNISRTPAANEEVDDERKLCRTEKSIVTTLDEFENIKADNPYEWISLPQSVIGTLLYFLLVEQNYATFDLYYTSKASFLIGLPVYLTFIMQFLFIRGLWSSVFIATNFTDSCNIDITLLIAAVSVYLINMVPSFRNIYEEFNIVLYSKRVAYVHDITDDDEVYVVPIVAPLSKRIFMCSLVLSFEAILVVLCTIVGCCYILSSDSAENLLINCLSVNFIMDIDDMARGAFQREVISDHIDGMQFESSIPRSSDREKSLSHKGEGTYATWKVYQTYMSLDKLIFITLLTIFLCYSEVLIFCNG
jgi:hypothetical protein